MTAESSMLLVIEHLSPPTLGGAGQGVPVSVKEAALRDDQRLWADLKAGWDSVYPTGGKAEPAQPPVSDSAQDK